MSVALANLKASFVPTPLATYLYIYSYASLECYINYMEGAIALAKYLAPIDIQAGNFAVPDILASYELMELASILKPHTVDHYLITTPQIENAIYEHLTQSR